MLFHALRVLLCPSVLLASFLCMSMSSFWLLSPALRSTHPRSLDAISSSWLHPAYRFTPCPSCSSVFFLCPSCSSRVLVPSVLLVSSRVFSCLPCSIPSRWDVSLTYCRPSARLVTLTLATFTLHPKRAPDPSSAANALKVDYLVCTVLSSRQVQRCGNSMHLGGPCRGYLSPWVHPRLVQQAGSQLVHVSTS